MCLQRPRSVAAGVPAVCTRKLAAERCAQCSASHMPYHMTSDLPMTFPPRVLACAGPPERPRRAAHRLLGERRHCLLAEQGLAACGRCRPGLRAQLRVTDGRRLGPRRPPTPCGCPGTSSTPPATRPPSGSWRSRERLARTALRAQGQVLERGLKGRRAPLRACRRRGGPRRTHCRLACWRCALRVRAHGHGGIRPAWHLSHA
jgi:hypothetical protein